MIHFDSKIPRVKLQHCMWYHHQPNGYYVISHDHHVEKNVPRLMWLVAGICHLEALGSVPG